MLEAHDATFGYPGKEPVLHGFSLAVEPGERVAVSSSRKPGRCSPTAPRCPAAARARCR